MRVHQEVMVRRAHGHKPVPRGSSRNTPRSPQPHVRSSSKPVLTFQRFMMFLVAASAVLVTVLAWSGWSYYATPLDERILHPAHSALKPAGSIGRSLGMAGLVMMLLILLYPLRKRSKTLQRIGTPAQWLQLHAYLGLAGPVLVTFHTAGRLTGLVAIAFYSMWAVVLSGFFGRYLYAKIPRTVQGNKMTLKEIEEQLNRLIEAVRASERKNEVLAGIEEFLSRSRQQKGSLLKALLRLCVDDIHLPLNLCRVWSILGGDRSLSLRRRLALTRLVLKQRRVLDKLAVLDASQQLFSFWHIFHRPFTVMMYGIVLLHVGVVFYLGFGPIW